MVPPSKAVSRLLSSGAWNSSSAALLENSTVSAEIVSSDKLEIALLVLMAFLEVYTNTEEKMQAFFRFHTRRWKPSAGD